MTDGTTAETDLPEGLDGLAWDLTVLGAQPLGPQDPEIVGQYRIHALLGAGGMGRVYLGRPADVAPDTELAGNGSWLAIKVIRPDLADELEFRERFTRELDAASRVDTPYAAKLVGGEADTDQPWMATEFVAGISLGDAVQPDEPLPTASVWRLAHDVGSALIAVHRGGIVHRDVKPSNVILGTTGAKIIDFGVACSADLAQVTKTGLNVGTPSYMAPEQAESGEVSSACDMFSLGVLLYFAVSGKLPFGQGAASASTVLFHVVHQEPDLRGLDEVEPSLRNLIVRCLAKDPLQRPSAMGLVALAKAAAIDGLWDEAEGAEWPPALSARIWERAHTAGRTVADALPNKATRAKAARPTVAAPKPTAVLPRVVPLTAAAPKPVPPKAGVPVAVPPTPKPILSETVVFETPRSSAPSRSVKGSGTVPVGQAGDAPSGDPNPGGGRRRTLAFASLAVTTVLVVGVAAMLLWGNGGGGSAAGNQAGAAGESIGAVPGLAGSSSSGAALPGPGSGSARPRASASTRESRSPATDAPGRQPSQSPNSSAGDRSPSAAPSSASPSPTPSASTTPTSPNPATDPIAYLQGLDNQLHTWISQGPATLTPQAGQDLHNTIMDLEHAVTNAQQSNDPHQWKPVHDKITALEQKITNDETSRQIAQNAASELTGELQQLANHTPAGT